MFNKCIRIVYYVQLCLSLILLIEQNISDALTILHAKNQPQTGIDAKNKSFSHNTLLKLDTTAGKDRLNAQQLGKTRKDIMKFASLVVGSVLLLFLVSAIVGISIYYMKKK